jgi:hypothetical protein
VTVALLVAVEGAYCEADELREASRDHLIVTSQRMRNPLQRYKPLSMPLNKIAAYHVYENGFEI